MSGAPQNVPQPTRLESADEIRQVIETRRKAQAGPPAAPQHTATALEVAPAERPAPVERPAPASRSTAAAPDAPLFRPVHRPSMALLYIVDDGRDDGECIRLRGDSLTIGRAEGDVLIPHDGMMSGRHAQLARVLEEGRYRWHLIDLQSTNGTYLRVSDAKLKHGQEVLLGGRRYRFDAAPQGAPAAAEPAASASEIKGTRGWQSIAPTDLFPSLTELLPSGEGQRLFLTKTDTVFGRDPAACSIVVEDPLLSLRHARFYRDAKGRWHVQNTHSVNGTWIRIERAPLDQIAQFQLGEQRFVLRVL
jgi:pSer/pThr/pTyr-binding forkhead associated (FHA) protein